MNVDLIFKIAAIGILVAVLNQLLIRQVRAIGGVIEAEGTAIFVGRATIGTLAAQQGALSTERATRHCVVGGG